MWSVREALNEFIKALELKDTKQDKVIAQHTMVRDQLVRQLDAKTCFLSGSYARGTAIHPLHDIDLFVVLKDVTVPPSEQPDTILKQVRQALQPLRPGQDLPILQHHSVHIGFTTKEIEFDVVPAFENPYQQLYFIPERDTGRWIPTNPKRHETLSTQANERAGKKLKPLIKAVKHWKRIYAAGLLGSFHLEAMSYNAFPTPPAGGYLEALEALFSHLSRAVMSPCPDPAGLSTQPLDRLTPNQREHARNVLASAAGEVRNVLKEETSLPTQAHERMRKLFGPEYQYR